MSTSSIQALVSTIPTPFAFSNEILDPEGHWSLHHFTTYTGAQPGHIATDHGALVSTGKSFQIAISDGMGHHEPQAIATVAAEVLGEVIRQPLSTRMKALSRRGCWGKKVGAQKAYCTYLKSLATKYKNREGTTLLQVEVTRLANRNLKVLVGKCGDSDVVVFDTHGKVHFATVDTTHHTRPDGKEIGLLAIGANFQEEWLDHATYTETIIKVGEAFVVACSDGLSSFLRNADGSLDQSRFIYGVLTGKAVQAGEDIPPFPEVKLTAALIGENLRAVATNFASIARKLSQDRWEESVRGRDLEPFLIAAERGKIHEGDDTTIITLHLPGSPQPVGASSSCSASSSSAAPEGHSPTALAESRLSPDDWTS